MRLITTPTAAHVAVWQELFFRWCALTEMTIRMTFEQTTDGFENGSAPVGDKALSLEDRQAQWQNLTLFLSAFGAACMREHHDPSALTKIIPPTIIPDCCRVLRDPSELLTNFLTETVNFLVSDAPQVRDIAREALSNEASPRLYGRIVKQLDECVFDDAWSVGAVLMCVPQCHSNGDRRRERQHAGAGGLPRPSKLNPISGSCLGSHLRSSSPS